MRADQLYNAVLSALEINEPPEAPLRPQAAKKGYGRGERAEFNVMGNLIKMTYRMQEYAVPNRIFVGASTAEAIRNKYLVRKAGDLAMRGSDKPVQVFEVSFVKTAPFVQTEKDGEMSAVFKAIAQKMKSLGK